MSIRIISRFSVLILLVVSLIAVPAQAKSLQGIHYANWSPDGKTILLGYTDTLQNEWDLYLMDAASGETSLLAEDAFGPSWSPDGTKIAYVDAHTTGIVLVEPGNPEDRTVLETPKSVYMPSWSPDGQWIAFYNDRENENDSIQLSVVSTSGAASRMVYESEGFLVFPVQWSPDSRQISFIDMDKNDNNHTLYITDVAGELGQPLDDSRANYGAVSWSPDGQKILLTASCEGKVGVCTMNPDGSGQHWLAEGESAVWSPDGQQIAYITKASICIVGSDGLNPRCITEPPAQNSDLEPVWSPDGTHLLFLRSQMDPNNGNNVTHAYRIAADGTQLTELVLSEP